MTDSTPDGVRSVRLYYYGLEGEPAFEAETALDKQAVDAWLTRWIEARSTSAIMALRKVVLGHCEFRRVSGSDSWCCFTHPSEDPECALPDVFAVLRDVGGLA